MAEGFLAGTESLRLTDGARTEVVRLRDGTTGLEAVVAPDFGGEVASLRFFFEGEWVETLHRGLDFAPTRGWTGRAPVLFPQVGRCYAPSARPPSPIPEEVDCSWEHEGKVYPMPCHGFARDAVWELDGYGDDARSAWARCVLNSGPQTRKMYPFSFSLCVTHSLREGSLVTRYDITAGEHQPPMPFTIGNHISFRAPVSGRGEYGDVTVWTPCAYEQVLDNDSLLTGERRDVDLGEGVALSDERMSNIVLGGYEAGEAWAAVEDSEGVRILVTQSQRPELFSREAVLFVFWGEPRLRYFCPEPWLGAPDALNGGRYLAHLPSGEAFSWEMSVTPSKC